MAPRSCVTLIVQSETFTGEEISRMVGRQPTFRREKGGPISRRRPASGRRDYTSWELRSSVEDTEELATHLADLLPFAESARSALREIAGSGGEIFWFCFVTAKPTGNMISLEPALLSRLADLGVRLTFDIYDSEPDD